MMQSCEHKILIMKDIFISYEGCFFVLTSNSRLIAPSESVTVGSSEAKTSITALGVRSALINLKS